MSTYRELIYMVLDQVKQTTDDSYFNTDHVAYLMDKYRALLLKQRYSDLRKDIPWSNYNTLQLEVDVKCGLPTNIKNFYLQNTVEASITRTIKPLPEVVGFNGNFGVTKIGNGAIDYSQLYYLGDYSLISNERFKYATANKWLKTQLYCTIGPDKYIYLKGYNTDFTKIPNIQVTSIFEAPKDLITYLGLTDFMDMEYPLEAAIIPHVIELVVKDLLPAAYRPEDNTNDAKDNLAEVATNQRQR